MRTDVVNIQINDKCYAVFLHADVDINACLVTCFISTNNTYCSKSNYEMPQFFEAHQRKSAREHVSTVY